jgi:hypothetical protein
MGYRSREMTRRQKKESNSFPKQREMDNSVCVSVTGFYTFVTIKNANPSLLFVFLNNLKSHVR